MSVTPTIRDGEVINAASDDENAQGARQLMEMLAQESSLDTTAIQTVGSKGYDGFAIARVIE